MQLLLVIIQIRQLLSHFRGRLQVNSVIGLIIQLNILAQSSTV